MPLDVGGRRRGAIVLRVVGLRHLARRLLRAPDAPPAPDSTRRAFYRQFVDPGDLCFDIGANVGNHTALFRSLGASVIALEPQAACAAELSGRFADDDAVVIVAKAAGAAAGRASLATTAASTLASMSDDWIAAVSRGRFAEFEWTGRETVDVTTLDELIEEFGAPAFCKIDVEGYELEVVRGLSTPIRALSFEFASEYLQRTHDVLEVLASVSPIECNYALGESYVLASTRWLPGAKLTDELASLRGPQPHGDVYVRCS
jgi:FkbM family methyltransferase